MPDKSDLFEIMQTTRAMRRLKPDPVPDALIRKIIQAGVCAPNGGNSQRWRFLVVKDARIKRQVQVYYKRAFDEVIGPRYHKSAPPPGVTREAYVRQHAAVEYLTDHFHEAPVWIVACIEEAVAPTRWSGASIYPAVQNMLLAARAGPRRHADDATPALREGDRGRPGAAARRALVRDPADRLPDGALRSRRPRTAQGDRVRERVGAPLSGRLTAGPQAEEPERLALAAELAVAHVLDLELRRHRAPAQERLRHQHPPLERPTLRLHAGGGVDRVAAVDDVLLDVADLRGDDGAAVQAGLEAGDDPVAGEIPGLALVDPLADEKDAAQAVGLAQAALDRPRHHRLVTDVLIDLAARLQHGLGDVVKEIVLEVVEAQGPQPGGDGGGVVQVQEHEDPVLGHRAVVTAQQQVHQRARAQHSVELPDEVDDEAHQREDRQRHHEAPAQHEVPILRRRVVSEPAAVLGHAEQAHRHRVDGGGAQGDVEERPHEEEPAHRKRAHEPRNGPQLEPRAAEADGGPRRDRRELAGEVGRHAPHEPVHQQGGGNPAARDPDGGPHRVQGSSRNHEWRGGD